jgi:16S rRNA (uracil1498-N3)-methyltransferase
MKRLRTDHLPVADGDSLPSGPSHHLLHVLRAAPGAALILFDGAGREQEAELVSASDGLARVRPAGPIREVAPATRILLVLAVLKHQAMDLALRMAVEAGVHAIQPVLTQRSVARGERTDRWQRIATAAASQCGRADEPTIHEVRSLREVAAALPMPAFVGVPGAPRIQPVVGPAALFIGPEGGFTPEELRTMIDLEGVVPAAFGPHVLRAETAAAVGVAALWGGSGLVGIGQHEQVT